MSRFIQDENVLNEIGDSYYTLSNSTSNITAFPSSSPTGTDAEEIHDTDAYEALFLNITLIGCVLFAYYVKINKIYYLPESAASMILGVLIGGGVRLFLNDLTLFKFSPEVFFFVLLPPIIFEAGYSLQRKNFFENIGAISLYAIFGTMLSCFVVGFATYYAAKIGIVKGVSADNPMEGLLFGALISAVDPVATLSIMGSAELQCNELLYSLVFGESVLNDAIAIVLFKTFRKYYDPDAPNFTSSDIPAALVAFFMMTFLSILVGVGLGLVASYLYKHSSLSEFPTLETTLLFLFCYLCYATAEAIELSGIMALFFNGIVLSHYNKYNLSRESRHASEQIFATLATVTETIVFLYMGMGVFTGRFQNWNYVFSFFALLFCVIGRAINIFPLSWIANLSRNRDENRIPLKMQFVLWFAGLRGAIAFALAENMPGPNRDTYATATLTICLFTTVFCGGFTETILSKFGMRHGVEVTGGSDFGFNDESLLTMTSPMAKRISRRMYSGTKRLWKDFDENYLKNLFGGSRRIESGDDESDEMHLGNYELGTQEDDDDDSDLNENGITPLSTSSK